MTAQLHTPRKKTLSTHSVGGWGNPRLVLNILKTKSTSATENQTRDCPVHRLVTMLIMIYRISLPMSFMTKKKSSMDISMSQVYDDICSISFIEEVGFSIVKNKHTFSNKNNTTTQK